MKLPPNDHTFLSEKKRKEKKTTHFPRVAYILSTVASLHCNREMASRPSLVMPSSSNKSSDDSSKSSSCTSKKILPMALLAAGSAVGGALLTVAGSFAWNAFKRWRKPVGHKSLGLTPELHQYVIAHSCRENEMVNLKKLQKATEDNPISSQWKRMCSPLDSASLLKVRWFLVFHFFP